MELGEAAVVDVVPDESHDPDTCYFCQQSKPVKEEENILSDELDEDAAVDLVSTDGLVFKNDAAKLGRALEEQGWKQPLFPVVLSRKLMNGETELLSCPVVTAAHHLIPGNAALKKSELYSEGKYLRTDGMAAGNIGYNVNKAENGVWLPGNYAMRPWGTAGKAFEAKHGVQAQDYADAAMTTAGQFHDAHEEYSDFVLRCLEKVKEKLDSSTTCEHAPKDGEAVAKGNLQTLISRLDGISSRMRKMLSKAASAAQIKQLWKKNIFTSKFVVNYTSSLKEAANPLKRKHD